MYSRKVIVQNRTGLHARPASVFVSTAAKFKSSITIMQCGQDKAANAKSIMMLLSLGLGQGTEVEISANGEDEISAVDTLVSLIESKFGE